MFMSTEDAAADLESILDQFRQSLEVLSIPGSGVQNAYFTARTELGAMKTLIATKDLIESYDQIFREGGSFAMLTHTLGLDTEKSRKALWTEYAEALVAGSLDHVNLFSYRYIAEEVNQVRLGLQ